MKNKKFRDILADMLPFLVGVIISGTLGAILGLIIYSVSK